MSRLPYVIGGWFISPLQYTSPSVLLTFENYPYGKIIAEKRDANTGQLITAPTTLHLRGNSAEGNEGGGAIDRTAVTQGGKAVFDNLPKGHYSITEVIAPSGYVLSEKTWTQDIEWGQDATVVIPNVPKTSLNVQKIDANDGKPLASAVFTLTDPTGGEVWQATSGSNGIAAFGEGAGGKELLAGMTYILRPEFDKLHSKEPFAI